MNRKGSAIGFAVYFGLLEQILYTGTELDADVLLLYDNDTPMTEVRKTMRSLQEQGCSVSAQRCEEGRYREIVDLRGGKKHA